jgi:phosphoglycerate dehydrogenase-like enzyme
MPKIVVPDDQPPVLGPSAAWRNLVNRADFDYHETLPGTEDRLLARIAGAEIVLNIRSSTRFTARVFEQSPRLRLLSLWGTGTDNVDLAAAARHDVTVTNTPGVAATSIAEHALALMLGVARRIPQLDAQVRAGAWPRGQMTELHAKTLGIIGLGAIGRKFAALGQAIGMRVIAWTMHPHPLPGVELVELDELYRASDVLSIHLRLSADTIGFIGAPQFALMKPGAILINTARGAIFDEPALVEALAAGRIAGAGLDVYAVEPLPPEHPFTRMANVTLTPHCAGITPEALEAGLAMAVENIAAFLAGRTQNVVALHES